MNDGPWSSDTDEPPLGKRLHLVDPLGQRVVWTGKRWYDPEESDGEMQCQEAWPPDYGGPWFIGTTIWEIPLAARLGLPVIPTYGSRYQPAWPGCTYAWNCRTCWGRVTDRYAHELEHRKNAWIKNIDALYETCVILFGSQQ